MVRASQDARIQSNVKEKRKNGDGCFHDTGFPGQRKFTRAKRALLNSYLTVFVYFSPRYQYS